MQKPKLFIGSSSEGLPLARKAEAKLSDKFEVTIWDEKMVEKAVFNLNKSFFYALLTASLKFDYGLLIGTPDDKVNMRNKEVMAPRDNVLFEFGLFMGRLGSNKCAFLVDEELNVLSDLKGISMETYDSKDVDSFDKAVDRIGAFFLHNDQPDINFFPSTTLASVYFENFLRPVCSVIKGNNGFQTKEKLYGKCMVNIIIPEVITADVNQQFDEIKPLFNTKTEVFQYKGRPRSVAVDVLQDADHLEIIDFPTILAGINYAIENLLPDDFKMKTKDFADIRARELKRFCDALMSLCKENNYDKLICLKSDSYLEKEHKKGDG
jgi:hypothetical protein